ncbi:MAG: HAD hydrolase-like protein [Phycisphaerales bacterium]|jgi:histidinol phosphatase-like enzyme|nr:HAD hydrolase-like protein [Phycisphaerales bacterium]
MRPAVFLDRDDTLIANRVLPRAAFARPLVPGPQGAAGAAERGLGSNDEPSERGGDRRGEPLVGDLCDPAWVRLLPGVAEGCRALESVGFVLVVVTNQGLVARGGGTLGDVERTNARMLELLGNSEQVGTTWPPDLPDGLLEGLPDGLRSGHVMAHELTQRRERGPGPRAEDRSLATPIAGVYACPFHPKGVVEGLNREHQWRKPLPGMILAAAADLGLDLSRSWLVGDMARDAEAGRAAGINPARIVLVDPDTTRPEHAILDETTASGVRIVEDFAAVTRLILGDRTVRAEARA